MIEVMILSSSINITTAIVQFKGTGRLCKQCLGSGSEFVGSARFWQDFWMRKNMRINGFFPLRIQDPDPDLN